MPGTARNWTGKLTTACDKKQRRTQGKGHEDQPGGGGGSLPALRRMAATWEMPWVHLSP